MTLRACSWRTRSVCAASVLRDDQEAARVLVEAVHDAGARHAGERGRVREQGVEQRSAPVAAAGVHDQPRRLVDDEERVVFVDDRERDVLGPVGEVPRHRGAGVERDALAAAQPCWRGADGAAVDA